jgi:hypothetical protein
MADVWLTKADSSASTTAATTATTASSGSTTPHLSELLAAPATDLLPGHAENAAASTSTSGGHATTAQTHAMLDHKLLEEEERHRLANGNPLI